MANTSSRTLRLLSLLQTRRYWPGEELARQLRVSPRTLRRDIDRLRELGYPIRAQRGVAGGYQLAAGSALPPLVVDDEEAVALAVGLQAAAQGAGAPGAVEGIAEASVRALAKVVQVMPVRLRRRVQALGAVTVPAGWEAAGDDPRETVDPGVLTTLALACRDTERVRFSYTAAGGEQTGRHVEPHRLVLLGRRWYLVGYDLDRQGWRSYRLDRLAAPNGTGVRFRVRELPGGDAAAFVRAGVQSTRTGYDIEVIVEAPAPVVRERIGRWSSVTEIDGSRCRVRMTADALEWPVLGLGMIGADFQVISPPELIEWMRDWGARFSRAAAGKMSTVSDYFCGWGTMTTSTPTVTERGRLTALRAGWLFDGTGSSLIPDPLVVIDGGTIVAVGSGAPAPDGADVVDLGGAALLPGLIDTHVHLAFDASADPVAALAARSDEEALAAMIRAGQAALAGGVTTVRDLGDRDYLSLGLRGQPGLPTILAAGPPLTTPAGHCHYLGGAAEPTEAGMRAAVREHVERGVDVIKIMASGGTLTPGTYQHLCQFTPEALRAAVDEAHRHGLQVTAHAHAVASIADAVAAGADGLEHVSFWTETSVDAPAELIQLIADQRTVVGLTVGLVPVPGLEPPPVVRARLPLMVANMRRLYEAGALMVAGSDAGIAPIKPHDVVRRAPEMLREIGIGQAEALRMLTSGAAEVIGLGHRKGRIAPGFDADILAVDGDPLADPATLHNIRAVYARGTAVPTA